MARRKVEVALFTVALGLAGCSRREAPAAPPRPEPTVTPPSSPEPATEEPSLVPVSSLPAQRELMVLNATHCGMDVLAVLADSGAPPVGHAGPVECRKSDGTVGWRLETMEDNRLRRSIFMALMLNRELQSMSPAGKLQEYSRMDLASGVPDAGYVTPVEIQQRPDAVAGQAIAMSGTAHLVRREGGNTTMFVTTVVPAGRFFVLVPDVVEAAVDTGVQVRVYGLASGTMTDPDSRAVVPRIVALTVIPQSR